MSKRKTKKKKASKFAKSCKFAARWIAAWAIGWTVMGYCILVGCPAVVVALALESAGNGLVWTSKKLASFTHRFLAPPAIWGYTKALKIHPYGKKIKRYL